MVIFWFILAYAPHPYLVIPMFSLAQVLFDTLFSYVFGWKGISLWKTKSKPALYLRRLYLFFLERDNAALIEMKRSDYLPSISRMTILTSEERLEGG